MTTEEAQAFVNELASRNGLAPEASDVANLAGKNPADIAGFQAALTDQANKRAASTAHRTSDSQSGNYADVGADPRAEVKATEYAPSSGSAVSDQKTAAPSGAAPASTNVVQSWATVPDSFTNAVSAQTDVLKEMRAAAAQREAAIAAKEQADQAKRDQLYGELQTRARQSTVVDPNDPVLKGQVDAYRAEQIRAQRNDISNVAEQIGPLGNIRGEQRMAAERTGINTASMQAQLLYRELAARRAYIVDAFNAQRSMLTVDQQANLQREVDNLDNQLSQVQTGLGSAVAGGQLGLGYATVGANTATANRGLDIQDRLGTRDLALRSTLGTKALTLQEQQQQLQNTQFYDDLGLRTGDRNAYWDAIRSGLL